MLVETADQGHRKLFEVGAADRMGCREGWVPHPQKNFVTFYPKMAGAVLGIFIWVGLSKAKQILGRPSEVVYVGIMGMTRPRRLGRPGTSLVGHGLPGLIARTASGKWRVVDLWCILVHFQGSHA